MSDNGAVWRAMIGNPVRFLGSSWPWRCLAYLVSTVVVGVVVWCAAVPLLVFAPVLVFAGLPVGAIERRRFRVLGMVSAPSPHAVGAPGLSDWVRRRATEAATWRELAYTACLCSVLAVVDVIAMFVVFLAILLLALPVLVLVGGPLRAGVQVGGPAGGGVGWDFLVGIGLGGPATLVAIYGLCGLAGAQAAFARWLLAPTETELGRRVRELASSRTRLVDAFEAQRRRIERDLHDGAQQHLVLLTITLGLAEEDLREHTGPATARVTDAHQQARQALASIRELIHGIHPRVLTDLGLAAAIGELAERCPVPVRLDLALPGRLPAAVESAAYFVVSEALTNVVRHAGAGVIAIVGRVTVDRLSIVVTDNGRGGADPARGTGLRGLADRAAVLAGTLTMTSPDGGPTSVYLELPCHCG